MRRLRPLASALLVAALVNLSAPARAEDHAADREARAQFQRAESSFNLGKFEEALAAYEAAYKAKPLSGFLFNIAQCQRNLGHHERALFFYRRYLALEPESPNRALVEGLIGEEEKKMAATEPPSPTAPAADPAVTPPAPPAAAPSPTPAAPAAVSPPPPDLNAPAPSATSSPMMIADAPRMTPVETSPPIYRRWWFWTAVGAVVAGAVITTVAVSSGSSAVKVPGSQLGTLDWR
jgi:tetratricopeptide (TPR) repeat protein